jgi:hypothetical protein
MSAGVAPDVSNTWGSAEAFPGLKISAKPKPAIASESQCFFIIFFSIIYFFVEVLFSLGLPGSCFPDRFLSAKAEIVIGRGHDVAFLIVGGAAKPPERGRIDGVEQAV